MSKVDLKVDWATHGASKYACENWHYSHCLPIGKLVKIGAWERGEFKGVIIFSRGTCGHIGIPYGCDQTTCCELTRVALRGHKFQVSRMIKIALKMLRSVAPSMRLAISFSAKQEMHHGGIYQAGGWIYTGETSPKVEFEMRGKRITDRVLSQIVKETKIKRREMEKRGIITELPTENKHRYLMPLDKQMRKQIELLRKPYPKRQPVEVISLQGDDGGSTPTLPLQKEKKK